MEQRESTENLFVKQHHFEKELQEAISEPILIMPSAKQSLNSMVLFFLQWKNLKANKCNMENGTSQRVNSYDLQFCMGYE